MLGFQSIISRCFEVDHACRKDLFPRSKKLQWMVMSIAVRSGDGLSQVSTMRPTQQPI